MIHSTSQIKPHKFFNKRYVKIQCSVDAGNGQVVIRATLANKPRKKSKNVKVLATSENIHQFHKNNEQIFSFFIHFTGE